MGGKPTLVSGYGGQSSITHFVAVAPASAHGASSTGHTSAKHAVAGVEHASTTTTTKTTTTTTTTLTTTTVVKKHAPAATHAAAAPQGATAAAQSSHSGTGLVLQDAILPFTVAALAVTLLLLATLRVLRKPPPDDSMS
jgi:hypothetical protein